MFAAIAANSLVHKKLEAFVGIVIYSNFQMSVLDGDSLSLNSSLVSFAYFSLFLLIDMTEDHVVQRPSASFESRPACSEVMGKVIYFSPTPQNCMRKRWKCVDFLNKPFNSLPS